MMCGDILTFPIQLAAITGERLGPLLLECIKGASGIEAGQYFLGFVGAFLAIGDMWRAALLFIPITLIYRVSKRAKELHETTRLLLETMADEVDSKDRYTHEHSKRVTEWTRTVLREMNVIGPEAYLVITAARLHDIGKISIPDAILHKHEQLTAEEWALMECHPSAGANMLERYPAFARGAAIVRGHHERWDGRGYPDGMRATDIPFGARIIAVADSFDAMTSDRPYREGMSSDRAIAILLAGRGMQWDPAIVDAFLRCVEQRTDLANVLPSPRAMPAVG
jgi:HD-GYP domain-containing protein (c-di-GMP phosphodiesterase class II)